MSTSPDVRRLCMTIAYDGLPFRGWQSQAHGNTIQDRIEAAFASLCGGERITVHGSGRTDAGVHARGQVAHADVPAADRHTTERWRGALNAFLPAAIRVKTVRVVPHSFHARFSSRGKVYRYRLCNDPVLDPFEYGRAWHLPGELDLDVLHRASHLLVGRHDFAAFAANRRTPVEDTVRTIRQITIRQRGGLLTLNFEGDGFLYKMVRLMTGTLVRCAQGRLSPSRIEEFLRGKHGKPHFVAPAEGLYLMRVLYGGK